MRSLADKADPFIKVRFIELAERYERELRIRSRTASTIKTLVCKQFGSKVALIREAFPLVREQLSRAGARSVRVEAPPPARLLRDNINQRIGLRYLFRVDHSSLVSLDRYRRGIFGLVSNKAYLSFYHENLSRECGANYRH